MRPQEVTLSVLSIGIKRRRSSGHYWREGAYRPNTNGKEKPGQCLLVAGGRAHAMVMRFDEAPLRALFIGGTGTISASCVRLSVEAGMQVAVLNRGRNEAEGELPGPVARLVADVNDAGSVKAVLDGGEFDSVVNFLSYDAEDACRWVAFLHGRTRQYVHISSASVYGKPVQRVRR